MSSDLLALNEECIASLALLFQCSLLLSSQSLGSVQSFFSVTPLLCQCCNASRQGFDVHSGRCQLMGKNFTALALSLSGLRLLGGRG